MADEKLNVLAVTIEARTRGLEKALARVEAQTKGTFGAVERNSKKSLTAMENAMASANRSVGLFGKSMVTAFAAGFSVQAMQRLLDGSTAITNALKVAGLQGDELNKVYGHLYESAQKNAAPLDALVTLYSRVASSQNELGVSTEQVLTLTDNVAKSVRLTGGNAEQAAGALLQLSQALGGGKIQAEEYNSLIDGLRPLLQAAAAGMQQAGGSVAKLTQLVKAGKVSSRAFFDSINAGAPILDQKLGNATLTVAQGFTQVYNATLDAAKKFNETTDTSERLGKALGGVAEAISEFNVDHAVSEFEKYIRGAHDVIHAANNLAMAIGQKLGLDKVGEWFVNTGVGKALGAHLLTSPEARMEGSAPAVPSYLQDYIKRTYGGQESAAPKINTIDISKPEYKPLPTKASGSGSGSRIRRTADDRFDEDIQGIKDRTAALRMEEEALGLTFREQQKRQVAFDLERQTLDDVRQAARQKGDQDWKNVQLTKDQKAAIDQVADAYAAQADELRKAQDAQKLGADILKGAFDGVRSALEDGKITAQEWGDIVLSALDKISDRRKDHILESLIGA